MGLDIVELVMEIEDEFDTRIPDSEAEHLNTPGDVADWLVTAMQSRAMPKAGQCLSQGTFYRLRSALVGEFDLDKRAVRPDASLRELITKTGGGARWRAFAAANALDRPRFTLLRVNPVPPITVTEMVHQAVKRNPSQFCDDKGAIDRSLVLQRVIQIVAEQMALDPDNVLEHSSFVKDLGMG